MDKMGVQNQKSESSAKKKIKPPLTNNPTNKLTRDEKDRVYELFSMVESKSNHLKIGTNNLQKKTFLSQLQAKDPKKFNKFINESK